jgi:tryptophanyl-tRNA synthetase
MRILSGIQPSGKLHLGNYFGALRQFVELQDRGEAIFFIADLHALTSVQHGPTLRAHTLDVALDYLALGLDPRKSTLFVQSHVPMHAELAWLLATVAPMALLERAHSYKDKVARGAPTSVGLFYYPILMAADILLYGPDQVPVGHDQKQHLEMARDIAVKFNMAYVPGYDPMHKEPRPAGASPALLHLPEPIILDEGHIVPGTDGQKMSKSYHNTIDLFAEEKVLKKAIMGIVTDSTGVSEPKPQDSSLLALLRLFTTGEQRQSLMQSWQSGGQGYGHYKKWLLELVLDHFAAARSERQRLSRDVGYVQEVLQEGAHKAQAMAAPRWRAILDACGCGRPLG